MLGASPGSDGQNGGLNPLYQIGGPRSVQLAEARLLNTEPAIPDRHLIDT
jgi:hypothetical protein